MRTLLSSFLFLGVSTALTFGEADGRPVHLRPETASPIIGTLAPDITPVAASERVQLDEEAKEKGWKGISFVDNFRGFIRQSQLRKDFTVTPGTPIYLLATEDPGAIIAHAERNDVFEVEQIDGTWAELSFRKPVTGFIREGAEVTPPQPGITDHPEPTPTNEDGAEAETAQSETARPATVSSRAGIPSERILRTFEGWLTPTRSFFGNPPPFPHQIVDQSGSRIAYVDLSRILITTPMDRFYGRRLEVHGQAEPIEGRRDFVIRVERMLQK